MRRRAGLVVAAALIVGAVGCGGSSDKGSQGAGNADTLKVLAAAQSKTTAEKSAKVKMSIASTVGTQTFALDGDGRYDFAGQSGSLTMTIPNPQSGQSMTIETVFSGKLLYLRSDIFKTLAGKEWLKVDLEAFRGDASKFGAQDPTSGLAFLAGTNKATVVGEEEVNGVSTTHYSATVDLDSSIAQLQGTLGKTVEQYREALGSADLPIDVWIDDKGRVSRMMISVPIKATAQTNNQAGKSTVTTDYTDWGVDVKVTLPKDSEVADGTSLLSGLAGG